MRERWRPVWILAGILFAINVIVRFIAWQTAQKSDSRQITIGLIGFGLVAAVMVAAGVWWGRRYPMSDVGPQLVVAVAAGCLASVIIGPLAAGSYPFREGPGFFFAEIWHYLAFAGGGAIVGLLVLIMLGGDYRSQALKRYAESKLTKPRRTVRR